MAQLPTTTELVLLFTLVFALLPAGVLYLARWRLKRGALEPPWMFPVLMVAGGAGGWFFALYGYAELAQIYARVAGGLPEEPWFYTAGLAPAAEELGKAFVLLPAVLSARWYRGPVDGLLYGFAAGAGFACVEHFLYFTHAYAYGAERAWLVEVLSRAVPGTIIHGGATAAVGAFLGAARWDGRVSVVLGAPLAGFAVALLVHCGWNSLAELATFTGDTLYLSAAWLLLPAVVLGFMGALVVGLRMEELQIRTALRQEVVDGHLKSGQLHVLNSGVMALGYAVRRFRREGRGSRELRRARSSVEDRDG